MYTLPFFVCYSLTLIGKLVKICPLIEGWRLKQLHFKTYFVEIVSENLYAIKIEQQITTSRKRQFKPILFNLINVIHIIT